MPIRFALRRARPWRPLLSLFGGTRRGSYVEIAGNLIRFRFGPAFDEIIPRSEIENASTYSMPWYAGIGWRLNRSGSIGLLGSHRGVVAVRLATVRRVRFFIASVACRTIFVSLEDPRGFLEALARGRSALSRGAEHRSGVAPAPPPAPVASRALPAR